MPSQDPWTREEDQTLAKLVQEHGARLAGKKAGRGKEGEGWAHVAERLQGRNREQCRARWVNQIDPAINKSVSLAPPLCCSSVGPPCASPVLGTKRAVMLFGWVFFLI